MSKISCSACGSIHDRNYECDAKKKAKADKSKRDRSRDDSKIYSSGRWKKLRNTVIEEYNNIDLFSYYVLGRVEVADCLHHVIEIIEDSEQVYERDNLIPLGNYTHRSIVHRLYKTNKKYEIQSILRDMLKDWNNNERELGSYKERYEKIVSDIY